MGPDRFPSSSMQPLIASADQEDEKPIRKQTARRRAYAKRSCLKCREKKARCELPDLSIPSSMKPLDTDKACHRCKVLSLDCIVWDGDRKRKPKIASRPPSSAATAKSNPSPSPHIPKLEPESPDAASLLARSPGSLEQLAAAAAQLSDQRRGLDDLPGRSPLVFGSTTSSTKEPSSTLASVQFFNPTVEDLPTPTSTTSTTPHRSTDLASTSFPRSRGSLGDSPVEAYRSDKGLKAPSELSNNGPPSQVQPPGRTWTSLWRPLSVLIDYAAQQPSFTTYLLSRIDTPLPLNIDVTELISKQACLHLKPFIRPYLLWHPHLPAIEHLYDEHRTRPTTSSALLLSSMCLVACRHAMPLLDELPRQLSALVDQLGTQILLSTPRDLYTVQALELLLAHEPSLVGTKIAASSQADRGNGLLGESLLAAALTIARGLDLDKSIDNVVAILSAPQPSTHAEARTRRNTLGKAVSGAAIWISLRIWEGHFSFVNSTVRPIDLSGLVDRAQALIAIDNDGRKIERKERDPFLLTEQRFPGLDEDSVLRSAGRTGLVYRLMSMARFQDAIADLYRILAVASKPENASPGDMATSEATRSEILESLASVGKRRDEWEYRKGQDFAPFSTVRPALLLEDWATLESYSLQSLLPCLSICAFMTGELNRGFSAFDLLDALRRHESFRVQSATLGELRDVETHKMLSMFHMFDRGLGYSRPNLLNRHSQLRSQGQPSSLLIEATGAPLLLTTAIATDGCKTFLEKTACSLAGFSHLPDTVNLHLAMMVRTIERLEECDQNEYVPRTRPTPNKASKQSSITESYSPRALANQTDGADEYGKSISQIGILFIEEMTHAMQKWKLGASLQRHSPLQARNFDKASNSVQIVHSNHRDTSANRHEHSATSYERDRSSLSGSQGSNLLQEGVASSNTMGTVRQTSTFLPGFQPALRSGGAAEAEKLDHGGPLSHLSKVDTSFPPQQTMVAGSLNGQGGMFDIPMFDLLDTVVATEQWAHHAPWFDPVIEVGAATSVLGAAGANTDNASAPPGLHAYHQSQHHLNQWSGIPSSGGHAQQSRHSSTVTLPPLHHMAPMYSQGQNQAQGHGAAQPLTDPSYYQGHPTVTPSPSMPGGHHHHHHHFYGHINRS